MSDKKYFFELNLQPEKYTKEEIQERLEERINEFNEEYDVTDVEIEIDVDTGLKNTYHEGKAIVTYELPD